jgi:TusA-related sulfurtransferase
MGKKKKAHNTQRSMQRTDRIRIIIPRPGIERDIREFSSDRNLLSLLDMDRSRVLLRHTS